MKLALPLQQADSNEIEAQEALKEHTQTPQT